MNQKLKPCPFCGSEHIDPEGWLRNDGVSGPACDVCGSSAASLGAWNTRVNVKYVDHNLKLCSNSNNLYYIRREDKDTPRYWTGPTLRTFVVEDTISAPIWCTFVKNEAEMYLEDLIWHHILEYSK